jgi:alanine racemase
MLPSHMKVLAVVKADAYGHGAIEIAKHAIATGVNYLGVAFLDEALELRCAGITAPILVMGYTSPEGVAVAWQHDIAITAYSQEILEEITQFSRSTIGRSLQNETHHARKLRVHIKVDTGMGRLGLHTQEAAVDYAIAMSHIDGVELEGLYTHYANADDADKTYTNNQYQRFTDIIQACQQKGLNFAILHAGNSATAIDTPQLTYNMVRIGISMYGLYPSVHVNHERIELEPVLSLKTTVVHLKTLPKDSGISYGTRYRTEQEEMIATLPVGYADGYSRMLTGKAQAIVRGHKVPIVGTICMDQCMIRVDRDWNIQVGDEVVLIGMQGDEVISADTLAQTLGTINYEITCMLSHRIPRVYVQGNQRVHVHHPLMQKLK